MVTYFRSMDRLGQESREGWPPRGSSLGHQLGRRCVGRLLGRKEPGVGSVRAHAQRNLPQAAGASAAICRAVAVSVYAGVYAATFEVNADPRPPALRTTVTWILIRFMQPADVNVIRRRLVHQRFYRLTLGQFSRCATEHRDGEGGGQRSSLHQSRACTRSPNGDNGNRTDRRALRRQARDVGSQMLQGG